jgi:sigma-B regulation protein RsbU (phosphoserine phosphatase)
MMNAGSPGTPQAGRYELRVEPVQGTAYTAPLDKPRLTIGRAPGNDLQFPNDTMMSRQHCVFEWEKGTYVVQDLASRNGTQVNGAALEGRRPLAPGDKVTAGRVTFTLNLEGAPPAGMFVDAPAESLKGSHTVVMKLASVIDPVKGTISSVSDSGGAGDKRRAEALIHAGRELVGHRPLDELFPLILTLATRAAGARRGALLTVENGQYLVRATEGDGVRISTAVRDRVIQGGESLLVRDAGQDVDLRASNTIVQTRVRSLMAVPLQTNTAVIGLIYVDSHDVVRPFNEEDLGILTVLANTAAIRIEHARLNEVEQNEKLVAKDLAQAAEIQNGLLPAGPPAFAGFEVAGHSVACRSVGGDYYDYLNLADGRPAVLVGDVSGKGLPAALLMTSLHALVHLMAELESDPGSFITRLNRSFGQHCPSGKFVTFFLAVLDADAHCIDFANGGHNPPLLRRASGDIEMLEGGGPPVGLLRGISYETQRVAFRPGDTLLLFSDGVTEAWNAQGEDYGDDHLKSEFGSAGDATAAKVVDFIRESVSKFLGTAHASDDITLLAVRRSA